MPILLTISSLFNLYFHVHIMLMYHSSIFKCKLSVCHLSLKMIDIELYRNIASAPTIPCICCQPGPSCSKGG